MTERIGLGFVLLVIALAHLMTDVVRLALEVLPRPAINDQTQVPTRFGEHEMARPPPSQQWTGSRRNSDADWPPARRNPGAHGAVFSRLPTDFSINQPPWCPACRHREAPRLDWQRRRYEGW